MTNTINWLKNNWEIVSNVAMGVATIVSFLIANYKAKIDKLKKACKTATEKAEELTNASAEQKKEFAMAIVRKTIKFFSDKKISKEIENLISYSKLVNSKNKKNMEVVY